MNTFSYDAELLTWQRAVLNLRIKYPETPAGLSDPEKIRREKGRLTQLEQELEKSKTPVLQTEASFSSDLFAGRTEELAKIRALFSAGKSPVVLCGIGGIGKTALAQAYAKEGGYRHVLWLTCSRSPWELLASDRLVRISTLRYQDGKYKNQRSYFKEKCRVLAEIMKKEKTLLVLDDWNLRSGYGQAEVLFLPCDILITSRLSPVLWSECQALEIHEMNGEEWQELYRLYDPGMSSEKQAQLEQTRAAVQGHTLKMLFALNRPEYQQEAGTLPELSPENGDPAAETGSLPRLSQRKSDPASETDILSRFPLKKAEIRMLMELSVLPASGISKEQFMKISSESAETLQQLQEYLLLRSRERDGEDCLFLHPVIAEEIQNRCHPTAEKCRQLIRNAGTAVKTVWVQQEPENRRWEEIVFSLLQHFSSMPAWLCRSYDELITWLLMQEYYEQAESCMKKLLRNVTKYYGEAAAVTGEMALRMAAVYFNSGDTSSADLWYEKSYQILKAAHGSDPYQTANFALACSKLSRTCRRGQKYDRAMALIDEAILANEATLSLCGKSREIPLPYHPALRHAYFLLDKGKIFLRTGRIPEAEAAFDTARKFLPPGSESYRLATETFARTEFDRYELELLTVRGDLKKAEQKAREMLSYALQSRKEDHVYVLETREKLADTLLKSHKTAEAQKEYKSLLIFLKTERPFWKTEIEKVENKLMSCSK